MKLVGCLLCALSAVIVIAFVRDYVFVGLGAAVAMLGLFIGTLIFERLMVSHRLVFAMSTLGFLLVCAATTWPFHALAQDASGTSINAGSLFSDVRGTIETVVGIVVAGIVGWLTLLVKNNLGLSIDTKMRDTLQSAIMNGVHFGLDQVQHLADAQTIDVKSAIVAKGIDYVRQYAPAAIKHFGLGEDDLAAMVKAKLAQLQPAEVTAVAKATGA